MAIEVHPEFFPHNMTWKALGRTAHSLRELQAKLPKVTLLGYYPKGYTAERESSDRPSRLYIPEVWVPPPPPDKPRRLYPRKAKPRAAVPKPKPPVPTPIPRPPPAPPPQPFPPAAIERVLHGNKVVWTEDLDRQLYKLVLGNYTAVGIAQLLRVTPGQVSGRCWRKGWKIRGGKRGRQS